MARANDADCGPFTHDVFISEKMTRLLERLKSRLDFPCDIVANGAHLLAETIRFIEERRGQLGCACPAGLGQTAFGPLSPELLETVSIKAYRASQGVRFVSGSLGDLGGIVPPSARSIAVVTRDDLRVLRKRFGADSDGEACAYALWMLISLTASLDEVGGIIGVFVHPNFFPMAFRKR
jgi:hypothetical protein